MTASFRVLKVWKDHLYERGVNAGRVGEAVPKWSAKRAGYDVYPSGNELDAAEVAVSLDEVWLKLAEGYGVRCVEPTTGYESILKGGFKAVVQQP